MTDTHLWTSETPILEIMLREKDYSPEFRLLQLFITPYEERIKKVLGDKGRAQSLTKIDIEEALAGVAGLSIGKDDRKRARQQILQYVANNFYSTLRQISQEIHKEKGGN